jgi:hypothetical protein
MCVRLDENNTCNPLDTTLDGYSIEFDVYRGTSPGVTPETVLKVVLHLGNGSQGIDVSGELIGTTYTVCEVPVANPPPDQTGHPVDLIAVMLTDDKLGCVQTVRLSRLPALYRGATGGQRRGNPSVSR